MADDEQLEIISEDGIHRWNAWHAENPEVLTDLAGANLENVYLVSANFENTNLQGANLQGANLQDANLTGADLKTSTLARVRLLSANLQDANLTGADLAGANLQDADLRGTNFREAANLDSASFTNATLSHATLGLGRLPSKKRGELRLAAVTPVPEDTLQEPDTQISDNANNLTVGYARSIVGPAHLALQDLSIPNDISEEHRDLFDELRSTVAELEQNLADIQEENRLLSDENEELRTSIDQALPLWKRAWEEFVLKGAGAAGASAGKGTVFAAGFIAGMLYNNFSPVGPGISV